MTRTIKLAVAAAMALGTTSAFATNGDHLIGLGAKARGMAGAGIGMSHGAESALVNPALISSVKGTEISFGGTLFMPNVSVETSNGGGQMKTTADSSADTNMIPEVAIANKVNENFYWGIGMWGTAGMGVDYRDAGQAGMGGDGTMQMVTNLQLMQFGVPLTFQMAGFSIGVTPILQYGALDINYMMPDDGQGGANNVGAGIAQDLQFGYNIGAAYDFAAVGVEGLTLGAVYKSEIEMDYKGQLSSATQPFVDAGVFPAAMDDKLTQPAEIGVGVSYTFEGSTIAVDYKNIQWGEAKGYKDFNWDNQDVVAVGYQYAADGWAVRVGYNYASQPIQEGDVMDPQAGYANAALNTFNLLGFPATTESHIGLGGTYAFSDKVSVDAAYTYAPETSTTFKTPNQMDPTEEKTVTHSQSGVSVQLNYAF